MNVLELNSVYVAGFVVGMTGRESGACDKYGVLASLRIRMTGFSSFFNTADGALAFPNMSLRDSVCYFYLSVLSLTALCKSVESMLFCRLISLLNKTLETRTP